MFFLLYTRHTNDGVFYDFLEISDHLPRFLKILQNCPKVTQPCWTTPENFWTFLKIAEDIRERPEDVSPIHKWIYYGTNLLSVKSSISLLVSIWKTCQSRHGCSFVWILRLVYSPVKHLCLYNILIIIFVANARLSQEPLSTILGFIVEDSVDCHISLAINMEKKVNTHLKACNDVLHTVR